MEFVFWKKFIFNSIKCSIDILLLAFVQSVFSISINKIFESVPTIVCLFFFFFLLNRKAIHHKLDKCKVLCATSVV